MLFKKGQKLSEQEALSLAIHEAYKGSGKVSPNPLVGAVILDKKFQFLSSGFHKKYGGCHAEIDALNKIKDKKKLKGAHVFVTLEPCSHFGKTPSCAKALSQFSIKSVVYGKKDINPKVNGKGIRILKSKNISVKKSRYFKDEISELYEIEEHNYKNKKTFVAFKMATTLDGMIGFQGDQYMISSQKSQDLVHSLRNQYDGVLIGANTFLIDNPRLNIRLKNKISKKNKVIILDPNAKSLTKIKSSRLFKLRDPEDIIIYVSQEFYKKKEKSLLIRECRFMPKTKTFDLNYLLSDLYQNYGLKSLLAEGGAYTFSSFLKQNEIQRWYQFISPIFIGEKKGKGLTADLDFPRAKLPKKLNFSRQTSIDSDIFITGKF